jgi:5-methylthioadenosine/S-adenosylhomocysteine deaminase
MNTHDAHGRATGTSRGALLKGACLLTLDAELGEIASGDVLIRDGVIADVGRSIEAADVEVIDGRGMIAIPGFVDTHRHLWEGLLRSSLPDATLGDYFETVNHRFGPVYEPEDVYLGTLLSALGALDAGVTTVLDWAHVQNTPGHTDASIAALRDAGVRAVFGFGLPTAEDRGHRYPDDLLRLRREVFAADDQLLTLALATMSPEHGPDEVVKRYWRTAREASARISVHAGIAGFGRPGEIERFGRERMLGPDVTLVHCAALTAAEWRLVADTGTTVSISTQIELQMGHGAPPIQRALDAGITPSLSVDVETSAPSDFFTQMRATLAHQRGAAFARAHAGGEAPRLLGVRDVLAFATSAGAAANGLARRVGSLSRGKQADIVLLAPGIQTVPVNDPAAAVVLGMDTSNVDTVMVAGRVVKRGGRLVDVDLGVIARRAYEARDQLFRRAGVRCVSPRHLGATPEPGGDRRV